MESQPKLSDLLERYLNKQSAAHGAGLATFDPSGEVLPFEAGPVQPVDPQPAWREGIAALTSVKKNLALQAPPGWPTLVAAHEPVVSVAFCVGNFPQLMRNLHLLLHGDPTRQRPTGARAIDVPEVLTWAEKAAAKKQFAEMLVGIGALRLAGQYDAAARLLDRNDVPEEWRAAWDNERAALAWHRGDSEQSLALWNEQAESAPVLFNRGMAALFLGRRKEAIGPLTKAVEMLPETSAWHHLGRLYLTLATRS
jgi:tetratricopeptide (TPR) repeat protein